MPHITIANTRLQGPIRGQKCPACGDTHSIFRETTTTPSTDTLAADALGLSPLGLPSRRTRLRCGLCNCQFPARLPTWLRLILSGLLLSALTLAALWAYPRRAQLAAALSDWCRHNPDLAIIAAIVILTALLVILIVALYPARKPAAAHNDPPRPVE